MWLPIDLVSENIGMGFEYLIPFLIFISGLTFFALNFKLGVLLSFVLNFAVFMWFYQADYNYVPPLVLGFIYLVLLAFSLYAVHEREVTGGRLT